MAILWTSAEFNRKPRNSTNTENFLTWSWISANGPIEIPYTSSTRDSETISLAYWCRPVITEVYGVRCIHWVPVKIIASCQEGMPSTRKVKKLSDRHNVIALARYLGCMRSEWFSEMPLQQSNMGCEIRLTELWNVERDWSTAFRGYEELNLFEGIDLGSVDVTGCIAVHAQSATLAFDWKSWNRQEPGYMPGRSYCLVRDNDNRLAGFFR